MADAVRFDPSVHTVGLSRNLAASLYSKADVRQG
jgi:hypothetical protein